MNLRLCWWACRLHLQYLNIVVRQVAELFAMVGTLLGEVKQLRVEVAELKQQVGLEEQACAPNTGVFKGSEGVYSFHYFNLCCIKD